MGLPFHLNILGVLWVVDAGRAASSTKTVDLSRVDALPKSKWRILVVFDGLLFYFRLKKHRPSNEGCWACSKLSIDNRFQPITNQSGHVSLGCWDWDYSKPIDREGSNTTRFNHWDQVKHSRWSLLHLSIQMLLSSDNTKCADVRKLTVGVGVSSHEREMGDLTRILLLFLDSRESWHFRSIKRSSDTFGSVLWTPYAVLPWVVWGSCAIFLAGNLNNLKYWFLCSNHPNQILDATKPTSHIH